MRKVEVIGSASQLGKRYSWFGEDTRSISAGLKTIFLCLNNVDYHEEKQHDINKNTTIEVIFCIMYISKEIGNTRFFICPNYYLNTLLILSFTVAAKH